MKTGPSVHVISAPLAAGMEALAQENRRSRHVFCPGRVSESCPKEELFATCLAELTNQADVATVQMIVFKKKTGKKEKKSCSFLSTSRSLQNPSHAGHLNI